MKSKSSALLVVLLAVSCSQPSTRKEILPADAIAELKALNQTYVTAWLQNDTTGVLGTLTGDAVLMPSGMRPIIGTDDIKKFWFPHDSSRTVITAFATTIDEVSGSGDLAYIRGKSHLAFTYEKAGSKSALTNEGMFLTIVRRQADYTWRISHQMWGPLKP